MNSAEDRKDVLQRADEYGFVYLYLIDREYLKLCEKVILAKS